VNAVFHRGREVYLKNKNPPGFASDDFQRISDALSAHEEHHVPLAGRLVFRLSAATSNKTDDRRGKIQDTPDLDLIVF